MLKQLEKTSPQDTLSCKTVRKCPGEMEKICPECRDISALGGDKKK
jgi:hypothetical protein